MKIFAKIFLITSLFLGFFILGLGNFAFAQGEANWWYFGANAGIHFTGGMPVAVTDGQLYTAEGCATASDAAGNLLFYTEGITVWNRNHAQMPNGFGLMGDESTTQSALIVQKPGSATLYYIFTLALEAGINGLRYSEVDMSLNAGTGDVTANKNIPLHTPSCEKITGVRHCNNKDVWVVTHDSGSNTFRTYLVTSAGINATPVISNTGSYPHEIGALKSSPDGKKLAMASWSLLGVDFFELYDFNKSTGVVSNPVLLSTPNVIANHYGVEFSPDGTKLYGSICFGDVYQFNLCAGSNTAIANSGIIVYKLLSGNGFGSLQLGPDKKIYAAGYYDFYLGVINNPNSLGVGCNFVNIGFLLAGRTSLLGLPNFVPYYFKQAPPPFTVSTNCLTGIFTAPQVTVTNCSASSNAITSVSWNFGDPSSMVNNTSSIINPTHIFTANGTYTVTLVLNYACGSDTLRQNVTVSCGFMVTTSAVNILCNSQCTGVATANPTGGTGPYAYSWNTQPMQTTAAATGLCVGVYTITITDALSATVTSTVLITQPAALSANISSSVANCGNQNGTATVTPSGGTPGYTYSWNVTPAQTTQTATGLGAGNYTIAVTDANGCTKTQTVTITSSNALTLSTSSTQTGCKVSNGTATASAGSGTAPYTYNWSGGQTTATATGLSAGTYTATVTDANGCTGTQTVIITSVVGFTSTISSSPSVCSANNGTASVTPSGGTIPYTYQWTSGGGTNSIATGLSAGNYSVLVTDANGCTNTQTVIVQSNSTLTLSTTSTQAGCKVSNGTATAIAGNGTSPYLYNWNNGQTNATATGLPAGSYTATVTDANGCTNSQTVSVTSNNTLTLSTTSTQTGCKVSNGTATANAGNGTSPYTYSWSNGQTIATATGLGVGNYSVVLTDANGCTKTQTVSVTQATGPSANATASPSIISPGANTTLTATGGGTYLWTPSTALSCSTCSSPIATPSQNTIYCVLVTDANGCKDSTCITINVEIPCGTLYIPNAFSPNDDGENEILCLMGNNCIKQLLFIIYDRWGEKVFETSDPKICWDGTYKGKPLNTAVFTYYLKAIFTDGEQINKKGNISLIR